METLTDLYATIVDGCGEYPPVMTADEIRDLYQAWADAEAGGCARYDVTGRRFVKALFASEHSAWMPIDWAADAMGVL